MVLSAPEGPLTSGSGPIAAPGPGEIVIWVISGTAATMSPGDKPPFARSSLPPA